jgi:AraC-like DNA-binding protein
MDWCGAEIHSGRLAFGRSSTEIDCVVPAGSHHVAALVPEDLARTYLGEALASKLLASERRHLVCRPNVGKALIELVHRLVEEYLEQPELLTDQALCKAIETELMDILFQAVDTGEYRVGRVPMRRRRQAFLRAVEYAEHLRRPIGIAELEAATGVSRRVLELAFQETLGVTPITYLRWSRMHGARAELGAADRDSVRVADIRARWGFSEPGRFAVDYRRLFGESPSATLRTYRKSLPSRLADTLRV